MFFDECIILPTANEHDDAASYAPSSSASDMLEYRYERVRYDSDGHCIFNKKITYIKDIS